MSGMKTDIMRTYQEKKLKRVAAVRRTYAILLLAFMIVFLSGFFYTSSFAKEDAKPPVYKYFTSLKVERGDTLWSIANEYADTEYCSVQEYIEELKYMNHMTSDKIVEGHYITIAYYSEEYK